MASRSASPPSGIMAGKVCIPSTSPVSSKVRKTRSMVEVGEPLVMFGKMKLGYLPRASIGRTRATRNPRPAMRSSSRQANSGLWSGSQPAGNSRSGAALQKSRTQSLYAREKAWAASTFSTNGKLATIIVGMIIT